MSVYRTTSWPPKKTGIELEILRMYRELDVTDPFDKIRIDGICRRISELKTELRQGIERWETKP